MLNFFFCHGWPNKPWSLQTHVSSCKSKTNSSCIWEIYQPTHPYHLQNDYNLNLFTCTLTTHHHHALKVWIRSCASVHKHWPFLTSEDPEFIPDVLSPRAKQESLNMQCGCLVDMGQWCALRRPLKGPTYSLSQNGGGCILDSDW